MTEQSPTTRTRYPLQALLAVGGAALLFTFDLVVGFVFMALVPLVVVGSVVFWDYSDALGTSTGESSSAAQMAAWVAFLALCCSFAAMLIRFITPAKFKYRPRGLWYAKRGAKA